MTRARSLLLALVAVWSAGASAQALVTGGLLRVSLAPSLSSAATFTVAVIARTPGGDRRTAPLAASTDAVFADLPPAQYDVELIAGGTVTATLAVPIGPAEGVTLEVRAVTSAPGYRLVVADRHQVAMASAFDQRLLLDLPASRDVWTLVETSAPYVIADQLDNGGARLARSPAIGSRSSSWTVTSASLGDVVVDDPGRTALLDLEPEPAFLSGVSVSAGLAPAEVGTPGVRITMTPRRPGPRRSVELFGSATTGSLVGTNELPGVPSGTRLTGWREGGGVAGGPVADDVGLLVAGSASGSAFTERGRSDQLDASRVAVFGHLVARRSARDQLRVLGGVQRLGYPFDDRRQFADPAAAAETAVLVQTQVTWQRQLETGAALTVTGGLATAGRTPSPGDPAGGVVDRLTDGLVPLPAAKTSRRTWNLRARWDGRARAWASASHALRGGLSLRSTGQSSAIVAAPTVAETVAGLPARVWLPQLPEAASHRRATDFSLWVANNLAWTPRLTMDVGLRLDRTTARARGAAEGLSWTTLSPRASVRWVLGPFALFAGAGRYAASHALSLLAHGDPGEPWSAVHRWDDDDGNGRFSPDELGPLVARAGWGAEVASIAPDVSAPVTREFTVGGAYQIGHSTLHGAILVRRETGLVRSVNVGVPPSSWDVRFVPDANADFEGPADDRLLAVYDRRPASFGLDAFELVNVDDERVTYGGIEIGWRFLSDRWSMLFGARAYRTRALGASRGFGPFENDQHVLGELYHQPNAMPIEPGSLFFDRSYVGKWAGSFHATETWRLAFAARYQDGQAFSRVVVVPDLAIGPDFVQAYRLGQTRYTYTATLDARVEKTLHLAGHPVAVRLDVFNLTNHQNELDEDVVTGPAFRTSRSVQPPLTIRLGLRVIF